jgi:23S rRNA (uracil1939-C5)-methyltransferase
MAYLVTSRDGEDVEAYARAILAEHPALTTFVVGVNTRPAAVAVGETERVVAGPGFIREVIAGISFKVSASSFFQTNTLQAERLVELVCDAACVGPDDTVLDLYCGAGTFGLALARGAREVIGFEKVAASVVDARENAAAAEIANVRFVSGDVASTLLAEDASLPKPDVVVVDPPRAGLHPSVVGVLGALAAKRIVYVSCNPRSAAVDLAPLVADAYDLEPVHVVDLFPHTPHVELVLTLVRRAGR